MTDPAPHERAWYRHSQSGDRGYLVQRNGKDCIRYDRPSVEQVVPMSPAWAVDEQVRALNESQMAQVARDADKKLAFFLGQHNVKAWVDMTDAERITFMKDGPNGTMRRGMFMSVMAWLKAANQ